MYLEPGRRYGERDRVSRFGALFIRWGTRVFVGNVLYGSAAYEAGLRWYDEIIAVDDKPLEKWTREEIDHLLEDGEAGSVHTVTYSRLREPEKTVEVTLRDAL
jgi:C-terminal processing protease CtpA/Prc